MNVGTIGCITRSMIQSSSLQTFQVSSVFIFTITKLKYSCKEWIHKDNRE